MFLRRKVYLFKYVYRIDPKDNFTVNNNSILYFRPRISLTLKIPYTTATFVYTCDAWTCKYDFPSTGEIMRTDYKSLNLLFYIVDLILGVVISLKLRPTFCLNGRNKCLPRCYFRLWNACSIFFKSKLFLKPLILFY